MPQSKGSCTASKCGGSRSGEGQYCCEMVKNSKANLQPRAMWSTSISEKPANRAGAMSTSGNKSSRLLSVLCSSSSDEVLSQQGHIAWLRLA